MGLSNYAMDRFVGTDISTFTEADIPDLAGHGSRSAHSLSNYILNSLFRGTPATREFEYRFHFFRRLLTAFDEYDLARQRTVDFLETRNPGQDPEFGAYFKALHHWEQHLMAAWHALSTMEAMAASDQMLFQKGDGSIAERLNSLNNSAKHGESRIKHGQMPVQGPLAVWLTKDGVKSTEYELSYQELSELLIELATWAFVLEDPLSTRERLEGLIHLEAAIQGDASPGERELPNTDEA